jgi:hypothetical protein
MILKADLYAPLEQDLLRVAIEQPEANLFRSHIVASFTMAMRITLSLILKLEYVENPREDV